MLEQKPILSICIPTYNRASYLQLCLEQICKQLEGFVQQVSIIIGDNASSDNTNQVVQCFIDRGFPVVYHRHEHNVGVDANIAFCLKHCKGEYLWITGDDDLVLDGKLHLIMNLLLQKKYKHLYLGHYWFASDYLSEVPLNNTSNRIIEYSNAAVYLKKINIWITFVSCHILKRTYVDDNSVSQFIGSNLNQLCWILPAICDQGIAAHISGNVIACKGNNSGGYSLFETFGPNLNTVVHAQIKKEKVPAYAIKALNYYFIKDFMPLYCLRYKLGKMTAFKSEISPFRILQPLYKKYPVYWLVLKPIDWLPAVIGKKYYYGLKKLKII
jgi:abequosyltransferase